jgi:hypothetical protein
MNRFVKRYELDYADFEPMVTPKKFKFRVVDHEISYYKGEIDYVSVSVTDEKNRAPNFWMYVRLYKGDLKMDFDKTIFFNTEEDRRVDALQRILMANPDRFEELEELITDYLHEMKLLTFRNDDWAGRSILVWNE